MADAEHAADIRAEMAAAQTPRDMLHLMRGYLAELDRFSAKFPETNGEKTQRLRAEIADEIARLENIAPDC